MIMNLTALRAAFSLLMGFVALLGTAAHAQTQTQIVARPLAEVLLPATGSAAASVISPNDAVLAAEVTARVLRVAADVGSSVKRGDVLIELDPADQRLLLAQADAAVASAKARLGLADQRLTRGQALGTKSFIAADDLLALSTEKQGAQADLQSAQAQRAIAARSLEKCRVLAPFDGSVLERHAQVGALATPGTSLIRLVDLGTAEVEAQLPSAYAAAIADGDRMFFESHGQRYPLTLSRMSEVIDPTSRTRVARFAFSAGTAPAGSSGQLQWRGSEGRVPATLLVKRDKQLGIFASADGRATFIPMADAQDGRPASAQGLDPTLQVVIEGQQALNDGDAIGERAP